MLDSLAEGIILNYLLQMVIIIACSIFMFYTLADITVDNLKTEMKLNKETLSTTISKRTTLFLLILFVGVGTVYFSNVEQELVNDFSTSLDTLIDHKQDITKSTISEKDIKGYQTLGKIGVGVGATSMIMLFFVRGYYDKKYKTKREKDSVEKVIVSLFYMGCVFLILQSMNMYGNAEYFVYLKEIVNK